MATHLIPRSRPDGSTARFEFLDRVSLRARISILAATVAAVVVVIVSAAAFFVVRANVLATLDANLLQRATATPASAASSTPMAPTRGSVTARPVSTCWVGSRRWAMTSAWSSPAGTATTR